MGGILGLDYNVLQWLMGLHGVDDPLAELRRVQVMEVEFLKALNNSES